MNEQRIRRLEWSAIFAGLSLVFGVGAYYNAAAETQSDVQQLQHDQRETEKDVTDIRLLLVEIDSNVKMLVKDRERHAN